MKNTVYSLFLVLGVFAATVSYMISRFDIPGANRNPAAIQKTYDFSNLSGESLLKAAKARMLSSLKIQKSDLASSISLGHFIFEDKQGFKRFACEYYEKIQIVFEADGVVSSGSSPQMILEGRCLPFAMDPSQMSPLYIPVQRIVANPPVDGEYKFAEFENQILQFRDMADSWPQLWILKKVSLTRGVDELIIPASEVGQIVGRPIVVRF
jgi:hypothetical protein